MNKFVCKHCRTENSRWNFNCSVCGTPNVNMTSNILLISVFLLSFLLSFRAEAEYNDEMYILTEAIYFEARNQPILGQIAVGCVILNRVQKPNWPNTIREVVWQRKQFSYTHDGKHERMLDRDAYYVANSMAHHVLNTDTCSLFDGVDHYINHSTASKKAKWFTKMGKVAVIGDHTFYRGVK